jgi:hypothetical protein
MHWLGYDIGIVWQVWMNTSGVTVQANYQASKTKKNLNSMV